VHCVTEHGLSTGVTVRLADVATAEGKEQIISYSVSCLFLMDCLKLSVDTDALCWSVFMMNLMHTLI